MASALLEPSTQTVPSPYDGFEQMPIGGRWREGRGDRVSEDRDPYTGDVLVRIRLADEHDLDEAFRTAAEAQPGWQAMLPA